MTVIFTRKEPDIVFWQIGDRGGLKYHSGEPVGAPKLFGEASASNNWVMIEALREGVEYYWALMQVERHFPGRHIIAVRHTSDYGLAFDGWLVTTIDTPEKWKTFAKATNDWFTRIVES